LKLLSRREAEKVRRCLFQLTTSSHLLRAIRKNSMVCAEGFACIPEHGLQLIKNRLAMTRVIASPPLRGRVIGHSLTERLFLPDCSYLTAPPCVGWPPPGLPAGPFDAERMRAVEGPASLRGCREAECWVESNICPSSIAGFPF
jgi:hypothetical protein